MSKSKLSIDKICVTCLSTNRNLTPLHSDYRLSILQIFVRNSLDYNLQIRFNVCWECAAQLRYIYNFQAKAQSSMATLTGYIKGTIVLPDNGFKCFSKLQKVSLPNIGDINKDSERQFKCYTEDNEIEIKEESCEDNLDKFARSVVENVCRDNIRTKADKSIDTSKSHINQRIFSNNRNLSPSFHHSQFFKEISFKDLLAYENKIITGVIQKTELIEDPLNSNKDEVIMGPIIQDARKSVDSEYTFDEDSSDDSTSNDLPQPGRPSNKTIFEKNFLQNVPRLASVNYDKLTLKNMLSGDMTCKEISTTEGITEGCNDLNESLSEVDIEVPQNKDVSDSGTETASSTEKYLTQTKKPIIITEKNKHKKKFKKVTFKETECIESTSKEESNNFDGSEIVLQSKRSKYNNVDGTHSGEDLYINVYSSTYLNRLIPKKHHQKWTQIKLSEDELIKIREEKKEDAEYVNKPYKCEYCILGFVTEEHMTEHNSKLHDKSLGHIICEVCLRVYREIVPFRRHYSKHFIVKACIECDYKHYKESYIRNHYITKHGDISNKNCGRAHQSSEGERYCSECKRFFKDKWAYRAHVKLTKKHNFNIQNRFECNDCGKVYVLKSSLKIHILTCHMDKRSKCELCDKTFGSNWKLKQHELSKHSAIEIVRDKICDVCGAAFNLSRTLQSHMVVHTRARPYKCDLCTSTFGFSGALYTHKKLVHKVKKKTQNSNSTGLETSSGVAAPSSGDLHPNL